MSKRDADQLRALAQNDYMIDGHFLDGGRILLGIADRLEAMAKDVCVWTHGEAPNRDGDEYWMALGCPGVGIHFAVTAYCPDCGRPVKVKALDGATPAAEDYPRPDEDGAL